MVAPFGQQAQDIVNGNAQTSNGRFATALTWLEGDSALIIHGSACGSRPLSSFFTIEVYQANDPFGFEFYPNVGQFLADPIST
jgi:hypothetical protein